MDSTSRGPRFEFCEIFGFVYSLFLFFFSFFSFAFLVWKFDVLFVDLLVFFLWKRLLTINCH